jgi:hypothetical protein
MATYPAGELTVRGVKVPVFTDDNGQWGAELAGGTRMAGFATRDVLKAELDKAMRAAVTAVEVPFMITSSQDRTVTVRTGVATGIHSGSQRVLVTWADGTKEQLRDTSNIMAAGSADDAAEWQRVKEAYQAAARDVYAFEQAHKIDLRAKVRAALTAAVTAPGAPG